MFKHLDTALNVAAAGLVGCALGPAVFDYTIGPLLLEHGGLGALAVGKYPVVIGIDTLLSTLVFVGLQKANRT